MGNKRNFLRDRFSRYLTIESLEDRRVLATYNLTERTDINNGEPRPFSADGFYETSQGLEQIGHGVIAYRPSEANGATDVLPSNGTNFFVSQNGLAIVRDITREQFTGAGRNVTSMYTVRPDASPLIDLIAGGSGIINEMVFSPMPAGLSSAAGGTSLYYTIQYAQFRPNSYSEPILQRVDPFTRQTTPVGRRSASAPADSPVFVEYFSSLVFHNNQLYYFARESLDNNGNYRDGLFVLTPNDSSGLVAELSLGNVIGQPNHYFQGGAKPVSTSVGLMWWGGDETTGVEPRIGGNLLKDIFPGPDASSGGYAEFWDVGGTVYFMADDGVHGNELWKTNGFGAQMVADIRVGPGSSFPDSTSVSVLDNRLVFSADDGIHGRELWITDDTADGAHLIRDLNPGIGSGISSSASSVLDLYALGGSVLFAGNNGSGDVELWQTDGTSLGTSLVSNIKATGSSNPGSFQRVVSDVYLSATNTLINSTTNLPYDANRLYSINLGLSSPPLVSISTIDGSASEGSTQSLRFRVTRSGSTSTALPVSFVVTGTASSSDFDIVQPSGFAVGEQSFDIVVRPRADVLSEPEESVVVNLRGSNIVVDGSPFAYGFITNVEALFDYGDAPTSYGTLTTSHVAVGPRLGNERDSEAAGQPTDFAYGDNVSGVNDEDGVTFTTVVAGLRTTLTATVRGTVAGLPASLSGWIDFNADGDFEDVDEKVVDGVAVATDGSYSQTFLAPTSVSIGQALLARFRLSTQTGLTATGGAVDGEVEDYALFVEAGTDYGDAPASYGTLSAGNRATGPSFGATRDVEEAGQPSINADGDGADEDGVRQGTLNAPFRTIDLAAGEATFTLDMKIPLSPSGSPLIGNLIGWIDWEHDGTFDERDRLTLNPSAFARDTSQLFHIQIPNFALAGPTYARFRISGDFSSNPAAYLQNGETEDYAVRILPATPQANDDSYLISEDTTFFAAAGVLANDSFPQNRLPSQRIESFTQPLHGRLAFNIATGQFSYVANRDFFGTDGFGYTIANDTGTASAWVSLTIQAINDRPLATPDQLIYRAGVPLAIPASRLLANDVDVDGDVMTAEIASQPAHGSLTQNADGSFAYTPENGFAGIDRFSYRTKDAISASDDTFVYLSVAPTVESAAINSDRLMRQRSQIRDVQITFSTLMTIEGPSAFRVRRISGTTDFALPANEPDVAFTMSVTEDNGKTRVTLVFANFLGDGRYELTIDSSSIHATANGAELDGDVDGVAGGNYRFVDRFFRLFGDQDGDGDVDATDYSTINTVKRSGGNLWYLDFNGNLIVDDSDVAEVLARRRRNLRIV